MKQKANTSIHFKYIETYLRAFQKKNDASKISFYYKI